MIVPGNRLQNALRPQERAGGKNTSNHQET
jgi:hypothetical protein